MSMAAIARRRRNAVLFAVLLLVWPSPLRSQDATSTTRGLLGEIEAPALLAADAERVGRIDPRPLAAALARAGLSLPPAMHVVLIPERDPRVRAIPPWIVGLASGSSDIVIFPERIGVSPDSYPYDSLESVVWHEVVHLALSVQAAERPLPRWFHEGVAMSVESGWTVGSQLQLLLAAAADPGIADLGRLFASESQPETALGYRLAAALVADIQRRHGDAVPGAIASRVAGGADFAGAFTLETGETPDAAAARAWRGYRRWTSWLPVVTSPSTLWFGILALAVIAFLVTLRRRSQRRQRWAEEEQHQSNADDERPF
jgi:hypothetical protein